MNYVTQTKNLAVADHIFSLREVIKNMDLNIKSTHKARSFRAMQFVVSRVDYSTFSSKGWDHCQEAKSGEIV